jgi:hypothetical protein
MGDETGFESRDQEAPMKRRILLAAIAVVTVGCVTPPLERYVVNQSLSTSEMRYQEVMNALAVVAHNPAVLPSYSVTSSGFSNVTATVSLEATTTWTRAARNFSSQLMNITGKHIPQLSWTLDPVADDVLLKGAWDACHWTIFGPPPPGDPAYELLRQPKITDIVDCAAEGKRSYHLGVFDDQHPIPSGWLGVGPRRCVPRGACYAAHCGDTYVWVMPEQMFHLSEFTLVLLDIATIVPSWYQQQKQQATASVDLGLAGSADFSPAGSGGGASKSKITETWAACQVTQADGSTRIVVTPFAEPASAHVIEKSTLSLYLLPQGAAAPARTNTPQAPVPGAPQSTYMYRQ